MATTETLFKALKEGAYIIETEVQKKMRYWLFANGAYVDISKNDFSRVKDKLTPEYKEKETRWRL